MKTIAMRRRWPVLVLVLAAYAWTLAGAGLPTTAGAQGRTEPDGGGVLAQLTQVFWLGPFAVNEGQAAAFYYTNLGTQDVMVSWAFSHALSGETLKGDIHKFVPVRAGAGICWILRTKELGEKGAGFDRSGKFRVPVVGWIFVRQMSQTGVRQAVDLPTIEVYDEAMGTTMTFVGANPAAPGDLSAVRGALSNPTN